MKKQKKLNLNTKLVVMFFSALFLVSMVNVFIFSLLLQTIEDEAYSVNNGQMHSATIKLQNELKEYSKSYYDMTNKSVFQSLGDSAFSPYKLSSMYTEARWSFAANANIDRWTLFFENGGYVVSGVGNYAEEEYITKYFHSQEYNLGFWKNLLQERFSVRFYPEAEFKLTEEGSKPLVPLVLKSYWESDMMAVFLLDMGGICTAVDSFIEKGTYIFSQSGELLYCTDESPVISTIPIGREIISDSGRLYVLRNEDSENGLQYIKLLPESETANVVRNSRQFSIIIMLCCLGITAVFILLSVRRTMHPVNRLLHLLEQHSQQPGAGNIHGACEELEHILKSREQQKIALAQRDAALSEYFLQSRMKNVYVDMDCLENQEEGQAYILYIQVHFQSEIWDTIPMPRAELENCLQEMMSGTLNNLFDTTMIFQLEPGRFAARVTVPQADSSMEDRMEKFMERLNNEQEFASFTVVQSEALAPEDDLASVYSQVQEAAKMARVCGGSQLLTLPLEEKESCFAFSNQDEKKLHAYMREGETEKAAEFAGELLAAILEMGISRAQLEMLCISLVNTAAHGATGIASSAQKIAAASGVYNVLISKCGTVEEYTEAVTGFIRTAGSSEVQSMKDDPLLQKVSKYIRENYQREFDGEEMAKGLGVSRNYLSTYYKSKTGMNLSDSIQLYRIQRAVELLKDPENKILDVGAMVGIVSSKTFYRQFKKHTGMTPKEWRDENMDH